ncbi:MAG: sigma-54-dependent transcriptional regulator, partial [Thermodesulfobacteriota bacterium]
MAELFTKVLIVDDEEDVLSSLSLVVEREGFTALTSQDGNTALKMISVEGPDVMLLDVKMPGMNGMEVLEQAKELDQELPVIIITGYADIYGAVEAMRAGAHDYLAKPFEHHEVVRVLHRALAERSLKKELRDLSSRLQGGSPLREMMGPSDAVARLISEVSLVAKSDFSVVVLGETGSGKELVARAIHNISPRSGAPFVPVDCGAIPEGLFESELFGYEKGAFTGAEHRKSGKFEAAQAGTLFLDEILNMPLGSQAKLLRALQDKVIYRVGGTRPLDVDVRLLIASNQNLEAAVESGSFRRDLFYRLNEFSIRIPPLRERKEDIPYLAKRFLDITSMELNKNMKGFSEPAMKALLAYDWPGNVRQLRSTIRRAALVADKLVTTSHVAMNSIATSDPAVTPEIE